MRSSGTVIDLVYQFGPVGKTKGNSIELHGSFETVTKTISLDSWSTGSWLNWQKQSPFDCRWQTNFPLNQRYKWNWVPLKDGDGYLAFASGRTGLIRPRLTIYCAEHRNDSGTRQRILWNFIRYQCVQFYDHWDAYFFYPCGIPHKEIDAVIERECLPYWWMKPSEGKVRLSTGCVPVDETTSGLLTIFPSRAGIVRLQTASKSYGGNTVEGVYLTRSDGSTIKILDRWVRDASMSPGGCLLALRHGKNERATGITVIDVCSAPKALQRKLD